MLYVILLAAGFTLGALFGRWWTLAAGVALGIWIGVEEEVEVSGWYLGFGYGALATLAIAAGVLLRRLARRGV